MSISSYLFLLDKFLEVESLPSLPNRHYECMFFTWLLFRKSQKRINPPPHQFHCLKQECTWQNGLFSLLTSLCFLDQCSLDPSSWGKPFSCNLGFFQICLCGCVVFYYSMFPGMGKSHDFTCGFRVTAPKYHCLGRSAVAFSLAEP